MQIRTKKPGRRRRIKRTAFLRLRRQDGTSLLPPLQRIAHRGASGQGLAPENTLASFEKAIEVGVDAVEIDVHLTADNRVVVIHDKAVDRTTDGSGLVDRMTLDEIRELSAGSWYDKQFASERIHTLEETLDLIGWRALLLIEAKTEEVVGKAVSIIRAQRAQSRVVMQSFLGPAVRTINRLDRRIPTAFLMTGGEAVLRRKTGVVKRVLKLGANALALKYTGATPDLVNMFLGRAMGIWVWTVDDEEDMRVMIEMGVGGIITNYPDRLNKVISEM
ncbi:MAG: glycerophosphodiester phosphodiesterase family protein [Candidatus Latescibacterota bacterium]|nr:glycerophosphodiester phosphodiesterase family protein [Candidatus Latescibacterota bacterium]